MSSCTGTRRRGRAWRRMLAASALGALAAGGCRAGAPRPSPGPTTLPPAVTRHVQAAVAPSGSGVPTPCAGAKPPRRFDHVIWIWMENHRYGQVIGSPDAPFTTALARACATAADYRAAGHPSLPNYLAATSGSTFGLADDAPPAVHPIRADNLFRQVRRLGGVARTYAEDMPAPCTLVSVGRYAVKHNPAAYYVGADDRAACRRDDLPLSGPGGAGLAADLAAGRIPTFLLVVPDTCNDTHDCPVRVGDRWLASWVTRITRSAAYRSGDTALFVVWDEPSPMPFVAVAPAIRSGTVIRGAVDHFALLRTTEELLGIPALLGRARATASMRGPLGI